MSDNQSQHERDDELLSAYLDDALSADERAAVESRLAADPAARRMFDELQRVSHAVRGLPRQSVGRDLRDSILSKTSEAKRVTEKDEGKRDDGPAGPMPKFTIGRTMRGWTWAAMAVAAALLIAVFQPHAPQHENLREVAQRDRGQSEFRAAPAAAPPATSLSAAREFDHADAVTDEVLVAEQRKNLEELPADRMSSATPTAPPASDAGGTLAYDTDSPMGEPAKPADNELVVVHVSAKREAIQNGSFDRLLADNGIVVDAEAAGETVEATNGRPQRFAEESQLAVQSAVGKPAAGADVDIVLVEAPRKMIASCLADLNDDSRNYYGVEVNDAPASNEVAELKAGATRKLAEDLSKYNRGILSKEQKDFAAQNFAARDKATYDGYDDQSDRYAGALGGRASAISGVEAEEAKPLAGGEYARNRGRARRVQLYAEDGRQVNEALGRGETNAAVEKLGQVRQFGRSQRYLGAPPQAGSDRLQVLFVLSPGDEPAASPAAENRAQ